MYGKQKCCDIAAHMQAGQCGMSSAVLFVGDSKGGPAASANQV